MLHSSRSQLRKTVTPRGCLGSGRDNVIRCEDDAPSESVLADSECPKRPQGYEANEGMAPRGG